MHAGFAGGYTESMDGCRLARCGWLGQYGERLQRFAVHLRRQVCCKTLPIMCGKSTCGVHRNGGFTQQAARHMRGAAVHS